MLFFGVPTIDPPHEMSFIGTCYFGVSQEKEPTPVVEDLDERIIVNLQETFNAIHSNNGVAITGGRIRISIDPETHELYINAASAPEDELEVPLAVPERYEVVDITTDSLKLLKLWMRRQKGLVWHGQLGQEDDFTDKFLKFFQMRIDGEEEEPEEPEKE